MPPIRAAFSLIELMLVISVVILLSSLSISGVVRSLRVASVTDAAGAIRDAAGTAQALALARAPAAGLEVAGVVIARRDGAWTVAPVLLPAAEAGAPTLDRALADALGEPALRRLAPNAAPWLGDRPARDDEVVAWFYEAGSGRVVAPRGGRLVPALVGCQPPPSDTSEVYGALPAYAPEVIAPATATDPGLSVRSRDQETRRLIAVQPTGSVVVREF